MTDNTDRIPLDEPCLDGNERAYLNECIDTNWISWQGPFVGRTEELLARYCNTRHGMTVVNGTYALVMALQALDIGPGDEVIVPAFTMSATAFAVTTVGATVVWVDSGSNSLTLDVQDVARKITPATKAVIAVHLYGHAADMKDLVELTDSHGVPVIEDVAEALGAATHGRKVGGLGTIGCHSFHNKIVASGEGGAITLNDDALAARLDELRTPSPNNVDNRVIALNNRMSNISCAVALAQIERINQLVARRKQVAATYDALLQDCPGLKPFHPRDDEDCVYWRYSLSVTADYPLSRDELVAHLDKQGIEARPVFTLMSEHPYYKPAVSDEYPNAARVAATGIDLPTSPNLDEQRIERVVTAIRDALA